MTPLRKNRDYVLLQGGQALSSIGNESSAIAYPLLILAVTHSPARAGLAGFARIIPYTIFGLFSGLAADRFDRKRLMLFADFVRACALGTIVFSISTGRLTFVQIMVVAFIEGTMFTLFNVAEMGAMRAVVPKQQLPDAFAGEQARYSTVSIVAPTFGGFLFGLSRALPFLAGSLSPMFSLGTLLAIRKPFQDERKPEPASRMRAELMEGLRWLWAHAFLRTCALLFTGQNLVFEGMFLTLIVVGRRQGLSGTHIGLLIAGFGVCSLTGSLLAPRIKRRFSMRFLVLSSFALGLPVASFVADPSVYVLLVSALPLAIITPSVAAVVIGYRVAIIPDRLTGRVNSVARTIALTGVPLGPLIAGLLLSAYDARTTVAVLAGLLAVLGAVAFASPSIRRAPSLTELEEAVPPLTPPELPELVA